MKNLLVVVDMVNGFVNEGALADKKINKITPNIERLIEMAKEKNMHLLAFKDCHKVGDEEFKVFPPHCIDGTIESELIPELKKYEKDMAIIKKNTTNGFVTKQFLKLANAVEYDNVYVVGCCTDICVKGFVNSYLDFNRQHNRKTKVIVIEDACYTFDGKGHNAEWEHDRAIEEMQSNGAIITRVKKNEIVKE